MDAPRTRRVLALVLATLARCRSIVGSLETVLDGLESGRGTAARMRGDTRAQSESKEIVATGAGVAASGGLVALIKNYLIGGSLYATSIEFVDAIQSVGTFGQVFSAFGSSIADLVSAAIPAEIVNAGVAASVRGIRNDFGVSGFLIAIVVTMLGVALFLRFMTNIDWSPIKVFFGSRD